MKHFKNIYRSIIILIILTLNVFQGMMLCHHEMHAHNSHHHAGSSGLLDLQVHDHNSHLFCADDQCLLQCNDACRLLKTGFREELVESQNPGAKKIKSRSVFIQPDSFQDLDIHSTHLVSLHNDSDRPSLCIYNNERVLRGPPAF